MERKNNKKKKGFTLIELIIVIAIIGILSAIAIPKATGLTGEAKEKADLANAKTIANMVSILDAKGEDVSSGEIDKNHVVGKALQTIPESKKYNGKKFYLVIAKKDTKEGNVILTEDKIEVHIGDKDGELVYPK